MTTTTRHPQILTVPSGYARRRKPENRPLLTPTPIHWTPGCDWRRLAHSELMSVSSCHHMYHEPIPGKENEMLDEGGDRWITHATLHLDAAMDALMSAEHWLLIEASPDCLCSADTYRRDHKGLRRRQIIDGKPYFTCRNCYYPLEDEGEAILWDGYCSACGPEFVYHTRDWKCFSCRHTFTAPVVLTPATTNISGEASVYCPKCNQRASFAHPAVPHLKPKKA